MAKEKTDNTQGHEEVVKPQEDWTDSAFPEANDKKDQGLDEEKIPTPDAAELPNELPKSASDGSDEKRYQYWQSQADKMKAENETLRAQMEQQTAPAQQPAPPAEEQVKDKEFPPPPQRPRKPAGYNREEAISDPASQSARYHDVMDDWRDRMDKYNNLYAQYNVALAQERMDALEGKIAEKEQQDLASAQQQQAMSELSDYVQATYNLSPEETQDFIQTMSQPESLNIGNLVDLYKMKGKQIINNVPTQVGTQADWRPEPSDTHKQVRRAQQIPSPMGVIPSKGEDRSPVDSIMDEMIDNQNKKNPF